MRACCVCNCAVESYLAALRSYHLSNKMKIWTESATADSHVQGVDLGQQASPTAAPTTQGLHLRSV